MRLHTGQRDNLSIMSYPADFLEQLFNKKPACDEGARVPYPGTLKPQQVFRAPPTYDKKQASEAVAG